MTMDTMLAGSFAQAVLRKQARHGSIEGEQTNLYVVRVKSGNDIGGDGENPKHSVRLI